MFLKLWLGFVMYCGTVRAGLGVQWQHSEQRIGRSVVLAPECFSMRSLTSEEMRY